MLDWVAVSNNLTGSGEDHSKLTYMALGRRFHFLTMCGPFLRTLTARLSPEQCSMTKRMSKTEAFFFFFNNLILKVHSTTSTMFSWSHGPSLVQHKWRPHSVWIPGGTGWLRGCLPHYKCWQIICPGFQNPSYVTDSYLNHY